MEGEEGRKGGWESEKRVGRELCPSIESPP